MDKAKRLGTIPLDFLRIPQNIANWQTYETEDIFATGFINYPNNYLFTLGSGIYHNHPAYKYDTPYYQLYKSLATIPNYQLPTVSQYYVAGRTVIRWGGLQDPSEIDFDHYGFTPDFRKKCAVVWKTPRSEPHHISEVPELIKEVPDNWKEMFGAIIRGEFK